MKKILMLISYYINGGPSQVVKNLIVNAYSQGVSFVFVTFFDKNKKNLLNELAPYCEKIVELNCSSKIDAVIKARKKIEQLIVENNIDIVHSHGIIPDYINSRIKKPVKKISTIHNIPYEDYAYTYGKVMGKFLSQYHIAILRKLSLGVCCSHSVFTLLSSKLKNTTYIVNGIDRLIPDTESSRKDIDIPNNSIVFIYIGSLTEGKNVIWLIDNFNRYRKDNEVLLILGDGPLYFECKKRECEHVRILGFIDEVSNYLEISDIYISASLSEGFSISVLQALSLGVGLFLSSIPSHLEIFNDANIPIGTSFEDDTFESDLARLRAIYPSLEKDKIVNFFQDTYSADLMARNYINLYNTI